MTLGDTRAHIHDFVDRMCAWFAACGRDLPWRHHPTAYQVWVSELMLQQTQVSTVIPYYQRWMQKYPDIYKLANADIDDVLNIWAGLGYYRRARYLYQGAQYIIQNHAGMFPQQLDLLRKIPGVGEYTAGAIASFAFNINTPAVDGNAQRVLSRFFGIDGDLNTGQSKKILQETAAALVIHGRARELNQAIMDLGASHCGRHPNCEKCPVYDICFAYLNGRTESLPQKKSKLSKYHEYRAALILKNNHKVFIGQRHDNLLLGGLWEFPMISLYRDKSPNDDIFRKPHHELWNQWLQSHQMSISTPIQSQNIQIEHIFTHIDMQVAVDSAQTDSFHIPKSDDIYSHFAWASLDDISSAFALSGLMQKICRSIAAV